MWEPWGGTEVEAMEETSNWFAPHCLFSLLSYNTQDYKPISINNWCNNPQFYLEGDLMRVFSQPRFSFPRYVSAWVKLAKPTREPNANNWIHDCNGCKLKPLKMGFLILSPDLPAQCIFLFWYSPIIQNGSKNVLFRTMHSIITILSSLSSRESLHSLMLTAKKCFLDQGWN